MALMILPSLQTSTCPKQNQKSQPTDLIHEKEQSIHPKLQGCKTIPVTTDAQRGMAGMGQNYLGPPRWMINNSIQKTRQMRGLVHHGTPQLCPARDFCMDLGKYDQTLREKIAGKTFPLDSLHK